MGCLVFDAGGGFVDLLFPSCLFLFLFFRYFFLNGWTDKGVLKFWGILGVFF